ncbi:MAG TPA: FAD-dependent oxidoreductase [Pyrinomonadaceae bacterium]|nr:FAD-dependent oxidoreductase [Pyrinomonadaceae bacterium]
MSDTAVCKLSDINDGEMKEVKVGETPVLLARVDGKCYALAAHCTHYGAPLAEGALVGDRIICPWHHACFHAATGDMLEPPALDSLPSFPVRIEGDDIRVELPADASDRRTPMMAVPDDNTDPRTFVIVGAGAAGYTAAQTLREDGFAGRIVMITREDRTPYDRPNLSKDYLQGHAEPAWMPLRPDEFYEKNGIEIQRSKTVESIDAKTRTIAFDGGETLRCDSLLIATGGTPRTLDLPGSDLKNIFVLRSFDGADEIIAAAESAQNVAVIGASFIGMEAAASLRQRGTSVTVIAPDRVPFEKVFGHEIGAMFRRVHESHSVAFRLGESVKGFTGNGKVVGVQLASGETIAADLVVVGIGVRPATDFITGVELHKDGGVIADKNLRIGPEIYAAGDIVHFPDARTGETTRIEHWRTAEQQGRIAAHNMAGKLTDYAAVPFFWTTQFDATLNYVGHAKDWEEIIVDGDVAKKEFVAYYVKDGRIAAVAGMNRDRELAELQELMRRDGELTLDAMAGSRQAVSARRQ